MNNKLAYLSYVIPLIFIVLSVIYMLKFNKLMGSGKLTYLISARNKQVLFLFLAILSTVIILFVEFIGTTAT